MRKIIKDLDLGVFLSLVASLLSLGIALFTLFWNLRPAHIVPVMNAVYVSRQGGALHLSIPLSIVNTGARPETVVGAKLIEASGGAQAVWSAVYATDANRGISAVTAGLNASNAVLWMPFIVPGNGEVQQIAIFEPVPGGHAPLVRSRKTVSYRIVLLLGRDGEARTAEEVTWPAETDRVLGEQKGGIGAATSALDRWVTEGNR